MQDLKGTEAKSYGVAHTPAAVVDFIVKSAIILMGRGGFPPERIRALDPFTGDGVFLASLVAHDVGQITAYEIRPRQCASTAEKYRGAAHVLCADAFAMTAQGANLIIGNPPYGRCAENAGIDARIRDTYFDCAAQCKAALFDAYVRAIRWASDNLEAGVIAYIVNNSFLEASAFSGFRKRIAQEFSQIFVLNLRGNHRTSGKVCRKEGGNVFANECRTGIAILFLIRWHGEKCANQEEKK